MQQTGQSFTEKLTDPKRVTIVNLNYSERTFEDIFSKMEFVAAADYLFPSAEKFSIPMIYTKKDGSKRVGDEEFHSYLKMKTENRSKHLAAKSPFDKEFVDSFKQYLPSSKQQIVQVPNEDIFLDSSLMEIIEDSHADTILFTGFLTETDVYASAIGALMRGYYSIVVSDATSTYSERIFYESLDLMSQVIEIIDTRDLMKLWGE